MFAKKFAITRAESGVPGLAFMARNIFQFSVSISFNINVNYPEKRSIILTGSNINLRKIHDGWQFSSYSHRSFLLKLWRYRMTPHVRSNLHNREQQLILI